MIARFSATAASCSGEDSCEIEPGKFSTANSGGLCQVNFFGDTEYAVYCSTNADGTYDCACGAVSENPFQFTSDDFCDLQSIERGCAAIEACNFPL